MSLLDRGKAIIARLRNLIPYGDRCRSCGKIVDANHWSPGKLCCLCYTHRTLVAHPLYRCAKRLANQVVTIYNKVETTAPPLTVDDYIVGVCLGLIKDEALFGRTNCVRMLHTIDAALVVLDQDRQMLQQFAKLAVRPEAIHP